MERISGRQLTLIAILYTMDSTLITVPGQAIKQARQHVYLSIILAVLLVLLIAWLLTRVMKRFPNKDLYQVMIDRRPLVGRVISLLFIFYFFFILVRDIRMVTDFTNVALLQETPLAAIAALVVFTLVVIGKGGIEVMARMGEFWGPVLIVAILFIPLILFKEFDQTLIMPFLDFHVPEILKGTWLFFPYFGEIVAIFFIFSNQDMKFSYAWKGLLIGAGIILILSMCEMLILGYHIASRMMYPSYELVRQLRITDFLDRFDLPLVGLWIPTLVTKIAFSLFVVCHGLKRVFPALSANTLVTPIGVFAFVCAFYFFQNAVQIYVFNEYWPALASVFQFFLPILLFILFRKKIDKNDKNGRKIKPTGIKNAP